MRHSDYSGGGSPDGILVPAQPSGLSPRDRSSHSVEQSQRCRRMAWKESVW